MAFPKFGPKTFRNAALGFSALAMASLPFAAPSSAEDQAAMNVPTVSAPIASGDMIPAANPELVRTTTADTTGVAYTSPIYDNAGDALRAAVAYTRETGGLGVMIGYGQYEGAADPNELGQRFQEEIEKRGVESRFFIGELSKPGFSLAFYNGHTVEGPMQPQEAASSLSDIVGQHLFYKRQLGSLSPEAGEPTLAAIIPDNL